MSDVKRPTTLADTIKPETSITDLNEVPMQQLDTSHQSDDMGTLK